MGEVLLDALLDSLKVFGISLVLFIIISFIENKIAHILGKKNHFSPIIGSALGLIPQCGLGVVASNLYIAHHITMGTLVALFISCSDEALPILLSTSNSSQILSILLILGIKFVVGFISGYIIDLFLFKERHDVDEHMHHDECEHHFDEESYTNCSEHHMVKFDETTKIYKHLLHPLIHSLKIFIYCLIIGTIIYFVGEEAIVSFLEKFKYFSPIASIIIGIIPNCASSILISQTYLAGGLSLGACVAGLCVNAGLGLVFIFKDRKNFKSNLVILGLMIAISLIVGYTICLINGF